MFIPTSEDVARYRRLRAVSRDLNQSVVKTVPRRAYLAIGEALGIMRDDGALVFASDDVSSVLMDCCLYEWFEEGTNPVLRFAAENPGDVGSDEQLLLDAYLHSKYRILESKEIVFGAGVRCRDLLNDEDLFLMDLAIGQSPRISNVPLATRTIPLGKYCMTGGAALPMLAEQSSLDEFKRMRDQPGVALAIVRACLAAGAGEHIRYAGPKTRPKPRPIRQ
jgi:hypothetical protein